MRSAIIIILNFIFLQGLLGQSSIEILNTVLSTKGDMELQYADNDSCICMDVWLVSTKDTTQRFMLDSATTLGTKYFFSPDEKWIAANKEFLSNYRTIILYKQITGIQYSQVKDDEIYEKAVKFLSITERLHHVPEFGHSIAELIRWLPNSKAFLLEISGRDDNHGVRVSKWACLFNLETLSVSLYKTNHGKVIRGH
jgi:hypothetical protein